MYIYIYYIHMYGIYIYYNIIVYNYITCALDHPGSFFRCAMCHGSWGPPVDSFTVQSDPRPSENCWQQKFHRNLKMNLNKRKTTGFPTIFFWGKINFPIELGFPIEFWLKIIPLPKFSFPIGKACHVFQPSIFRGELLNFGGGIILNAVDATKALGVPKCSECVGIKYPNAHIWHFRSSQVFSASCRAS